MSQTTTAAARKGNSTAKNAQQIAEIETGLRTLIGAESGVPFEIRAVRITGGADRGIFDNYEIAARTIAQLDNSGRYSGVYVTLNRIKPELASAVTNKMGSRYSVTDQDIVRRFWLPIDLDPERKGKVSASEAEKEFARQKAAAVKAFLAGCRWPAPLEIDSGNGFHLLYRIDFENDDRSTAIVKAILSNLSARFTDSNVKVDTEVFNAARIWKIPGTTARKGKHTTDRPHRKARILTGANHE